jgi:NAD-dependent histone deacetylase SIR2
MSVPGVLESFVEKREEREEEEITNKPRPKAKPRLPKRKDKEPKDIVDFGHITSMDYKYADIVNDDVRRDLAILHHVFKHSRRLIVITGAGISVSAGIPDFRSQTGLFTTLKGDLKLKSSGKEMFDASVYQDGQATSNFHSTVKDLHKLCNTASPTRFHEYLNSISNEGRLARLYTQNIDCLDTKLPGLNTKTPLERPWPKTVQLHGTINTMVCSKCHWTSPLQPDLFDTEEVGQVPDCPECLELDNVRKIAGKRTQGVGKLRPRIVLYNEGNPDAEAIGSVSESDLNSRPDGLVVVGTTLKIPGVKRIVREMAQAVHAAKGAVVWMNIDDPPQFYNMKEFENTFDLIVKGDCQIIPQLIEDYDQEKQQIAHEKEQLKQQRRQKTQSKKTQTKVSDTFKISKQSQQPIKKEQDPPKIEYAKSDLNYILHN